MAALETCTQCDAQLAGVIRHPTKSAWILNCPMCGEFEITEEELAAWKHTKKQAE